MKCPYCGEEMIRGYLMSSRDITFAVDNVTKVFRIKQSDDLELSSLRQMMSDGLAYRHDYHEQPPRVEYGLTELGTKMLPIVNSLADFGNYYKSIIEQNQVR